MRFTDLIPVQRAPKMFGSRVFYLLQASDPSKGRIPDGDKILPFPVDSAVRRWGIDFLNHCIRHGMKAETYTGFDRWPIVYPAYWAVHNWRRAGGNPTVLVDGIPDQHTCSRIYEAWWNVGKGYGQQLWIASDRSYIFAYGDGVLSPVLRGAIKG